VKTRIMSY